MKHTKRLLSIILSLIMVTGCIAGTDLTAYAASPKQVASLSYSDLTTSTVKLRWKKISGVTGYYVYKYTKSNNKYKKIATVKSTSYTVKNLKAGTTYRYTVKAYRKNGKKVTTGKMSKKLTLSTKPSKVKGLVSRVYETKSITLNWSKVKNATGYQVYKYDTKKKKYVKTATVKTNKVKISSLSSNKSYKFKVRAYRTIEKKNYYGAFSSIITKSTLKNVDIKSKLVNGYLYYSDDTYNGLDEYIFYNDGSYVHNYYEIDYSQYDNTYYGTYKIKNGIVYLSGDYNRDKKLYFDSNKNYFRSFSFDEYESNDWSYHRYFYKTDKVNPSERKKFKSEINYKCWVFE